MDKIECPYCGEKIDATEKICPYCGEGLINKPSPTITTAVEQPSVNINRKLMYVLMVVVSLVSAFNIVWLYPSVEVTCLYLYPIMLAFVFALIGFFKKDVELVCLRFWTAVDVFYLCCLLFLRNPQWLDLWFQPKSSFVLLALTAIFVFFVMRHLSSKVLSMLFVIASSLYALITIALYAYFFIFIR